MYQGFSLKFLKTKISQILFSVTKLIEHPEQTFNLNRTNGSIKNLRHNYHDKTSNNICAKFYATGTINKGIDML